jgi:hypothetical protein
MPSRRLLSRLALALCCSAMLAPAAADDLGITSLQRHVGLREYRFPTVMSFRPDVTARVNYQLFATVFSPLPYGLPPVNPGDSLKLSILDKDGQQPLVRLNYRLLRNDTRVFAVEFQGEYCTTRCDTVRRPAAFDLASGRLLTAQDLFTPDGHAALIASMSARQRGTLEREIAIRRQPGARRDADAQAALAIYQQCLKERYAGRDWPYAGDMAIEPEHITFSHGSCSTPATRTLDELGPLRHRFTLNQLRPWLSSYGRAVLLGDPPAAATSPQGQLLAGTLGGARVQLHLAPASGHPLARDGEPVSAYYFHERERRPVPLQGQWRQGVLTLQEMQGQEPRPTLTLKQQGTTLTGSWKSNAGTKALPVSLQIP